MNSILFMYIETETEKLSGHIDLTARYPSCRVFNFTNLIFSMRLKLRLRKRHTRNGNIYWLSLSCPCTWCGSFFPNVSFKNHYLNGLSTANEKLLFSGLEANSHDKTNHNMKRA